MSLTLCPYCQRLCFTDSASCPGCSHTFQAGVLQAQAVAEEKAFSRKANALFLSAFLMVLGVLLFFQLQAYVNGNGLFRP